LKVIGTAGHVDHGKSALVTALTGIDPDRLKEEKEREMTIELGFAWLTLPNGDTVSVVDVPGHEHFIKNMLAGVGGIDAALLVVAADEGVMPQTREHLAILNLLHVSAGVVALTKMDLVQDPDWLELVRDDVASALADTSLAGAEIVPVSARTGQGLEELTGQIQAALEDTPAHEDRGKPRLPIDRVFSMAGFGTVVTGTLADGALEVGKEVELVPGGKRARIRGLQVHKEKVQRALPGRRVAVNLTGVPTAGLDRGQVVTLPGQIRPTRLVDVLLHVIPDAPRPLPHDFRVEFFTGAAEVEAKIRILEGKEIRPGQQGWGQAILSKQVPAVRGDRFIVRQPSPSVTLGGGVVLDPHPRGRHRLNRPEVIARLKKLAHGTPQDLLLQSLETMGPVAGREVIGRSQLPAHEAEGLLADLLKDGQVVALDKLKDNPPSTRLVLARTALSTLFSKIESALQGYHRAHPLRAGMPREEVKSRLGLGARAFNALINYLASEGSVREDGALLSLPGHQVTFEPELQARIDGLMKRFNTEPYAPPSAAESREEIGNEALMALVQRGDLVRVSEGVLFSAEAYGEMVASIVNHLEAEGTIKVSKVRDLFGTSRKYALALMEHMDEERLTQRRGDERVLHPARRKD
jgi:selenocysteine-specific elongation factor